MKRVSVSVLVAVVVLLGIAVPTSGAAEAERHCYVRVIDKKPSGELVTSAPSCYATMSQMQQAAYAPSARVSGATTQSTLLLATHYDGTGWSGSSTSVYGADCAGGWLNTSSPWNTSISSTANGCNTVRHFHDQNLSGSRSDTFGAGGNLNSLVTNHAYSIQYAT